MTKRFSILLTCVLALGPVLASPAAAQDANYGQPGDWIRAFGRRCVKLDAKGLSRAKDDWADIGEGDLPWKQVQKALSDIGFTGWATAEVGVTASHQLGERGRVQLLV